MADINDFHGTRIGRHTIEGVEMLDNDTCILYFEEEFDKGENNAGVCTQVERWLDEDKWVFQDLWYDSEGMFLDSVESERLCGWEIKKSKEIINEFLKQVQ